MALNLHGPPASHCLSAAAPALERPPLLLRPHRPSHCRCRCPCHKQVLHIIRHGESEYNAATNGPRWEDPEIFDAPLTAKGRAQARALQG